MTPEKKADSVKERKDHYVSAVVEVATAEGNLELVADELRMFSIALEKSRELYEALSNLSIPLEKRQQIIEDLLSKKATRTTIGLIGLLVSIGRVKDISSIVEALNERVAKLKIMEVAYVRTAVALDEAQKNQLQKALNQATQKELDLKIVVDPDLMGGVVATIGDTIIDGSVKSRLQKLRETLGE